MLHQIFGWNSLVPLLQILHKQGFHALFVILFLVPILFINLVFKNLCKQSNVPFQRGVDLDCVYDACSWFDYKRLQTVLLVQKCEHVLFNRLNWQTACDWVSIVLDFRSKQVCKELSQLSETHVWLFVAERTEDLLWITLGSRGGWVSGHRAKDGPHTAARGYNLRLLARIARISYYFRRFKAELASRKSEFLRVAALFVKVECAAHSPFVEVNFLQGQDRLHNLQCLSLLRYHIPVLFLYFFVLHKQFTDPLLILLCQVIYSRLKIKCLLFQLVRTKFLVW